MRLLRSMRLLHLLASRVSLAKNESRCSTSLPSHQMRRVGSWIERLVHASGLLLAGKISERHKTARLRRQSKSPIGPGAGESSLPLLHRLEGRPRLCSYQDAASKSVDLGLLVSLSSIIPSNTLTIEASFFQTPARLARRCERSSWLIPSPSIVTSTEAPSGRPGSDSSSSRRPWRTPRK